MSLKLSQSLKRSIDVITDLESEPENFEHNFAALYASLAVLLDELRVSAPDIYLKTSSLATAAYKLLQSTPAPETILNRKLHS